MQQSCNVAGLGKDRFGDDSSGLGIATGLFYNNRLPVVRDLPIFWECGDSLAIKRGGD